MFLQRADVQPLTYAIYQIKQEQKLRLIPEDHLNPILYRKSQTGFIGEQFIPIICNKPNTPSFSNCFCLLLAKIHIFHLLQPRDGCKAHHSHTTQLSPSDMPKTLPIKCSVPLFPSAKFTLYLHLSLTAQCNSLWDMSRIHDTSPIA